MRTKKFSIVMLCMLLAVGLLYGCGSSKKEGAESPTSPEQVGTAGADSVCEQCHASVDSITGESIIAQYEASSPHKGQTFPNNLNGCEACHGGGAEHWGVGPIPFPNPFANDGTRCTFCHNGQFATNAPTKFASSKHANMTIEDGNPCRRCHTGEGAVLGARAGLTGDGNLMDNPDFQNAVPSQSTFSAFTCDTCHQHGGGLRRVNTRDAAGNLVVWNPSRTSQVNDTFNLCTGCHGLKTNEGKIMASGTAASGTVKVGHHENTWYRIIATTHLNNSDNPTNGITGYVMRIPGLQEEYDERGTINPHANACYDCHGHEARTETSNNPNATNFKPTVTTIHRDWALSLHAGGLLQAKYDAAGNNVRTVETVDAVMNAAAGDADPWSHYDWSNATGTADDRKACQMCHTSTGFSNYANNSAGYDPAKNDFSHLAGWTQNNRSSKQREMLYCWGCHSNNSSGLLRITNGQAQLSFQLQPGQPIIIQNVGKSAVCVICHGGRGSVGANILNDVRSSRFDGHHAPVAGIMFASQTHMAFEYPGQNYTNPAFKHFQINAATEGPCASCHMPVNASGSPSHTFAPVEENDVITKINAQSLCDTCHGGAINPASLEALSGGYEEASTILNNYNSNLPGFKNYLNLAITSSNFSDRVAVPDPAYGAWQNGKIINDEPCAYVHNPTYIKRIIFDSIDWMDNGVLNGTITFDATAFPEAAAWLGKPGASGVTTFSRL